MKDHTYLLHQQKYFCFFVCVCGMKRNAQHFLCVTDGDWKMARKQKESPLHILEPVDLKVIFSRAMVVKDSRMAKSVCGVFFFFS